MQKEVECLRALNAYQVPTPISKVPSNVENALQGFNVKVKVSWSQKNEKGIVRPDISDDDSGKKQEQIQTHSLSIALSLTHTHTLTLTLTLTLTQHSLSHTKHTHTHTQH